MWCGFDFSVPVKLSAASHVLPSSDCTPVRGQRECGTEYQIFFAQWLPSRVIGYVAAWRS